MISRGSKPPATKLLPADKEGPTPDPTPVRKPRGRSTNTVPAATAFFAFVLFNLLVLGANVVGQCLRERLIDELLIVLLPVLLGDGVRLFDQPGVTAGLELVDGSVSGQVVNLRYRVGSS